MNPNHSIHETINQNLANYEEVSETFFEETKLTMMKDLIDFSNRQEFDQYMRSIEKSYYEQLNIPKPPYEQIPEFPPKPYTPSEKRRSHYDQTKDYIDKVNELNEKRQNAYSRQLQDYNRQQTQGYSYTHQLPNSQVNPYSTPYFDYSVNKDNFSQLLGQAQTLQQPYQSGFVPQGYPQHIGMGPDKFNQVMEPSRMGMTPSYMQKFVAGPVRLEHNPLSEPQRSFRGSSPPKSQGPPAGAESDFRNPDAQYERYKQLMSSQYYNHHVNSSHAGYPSASVKTIYEPPAHFTAATQFQYSQNPLPIPQGQNTMFDVSFNPQKPITQGLQAQPMGQIMNPSMYPQHNQIYGAPMPRPTSYNQPGPQWNTTQGGYPNVRPEVYRSMKYQNRVPDEVIESIGGIEDTLKPLEETLRQHELRPYQIQRDYKRDFEQSKSGRRTNSEIRPENVKLVSVSPFRAVVKVEQDDQDFQENEDELQRDEGLDPSKVRTTISERRQHSPIKHDSEFLRSQRDNFLKTFSDRRGSHQEQQQQKNMQRKDSGLKVNKESQLLRNQREMYLQSFSSQGFQEMRPPVHNSNKQHVPGLQINV